MSAQTIDRKAIPLILFISLIWSGNIVSIKIAAHEIPPMAMATLRFAIAGGGIFLYCILRNISLRLNRGEIKYHLISGGLFSMQIGLFYLGTYQAIAAHAAVLIHTNIFFVAILTHFFIPDDRLTLKKVIGLSVAFLGILLIFSDRLSHPDVSYTGNLIILTSALILAGKTLYIKRLIDTIHPVKVVFWQMAFGVPLLSGFSILLLETPPVTYSAQLIAILFYQGLIVGAFCFVVSTHLLKRYPASQMVSFSTTVPIFGVILCHLILGEAITPYLTISLGLVTAGIFLINVQESAIAQE